jgi:hypothetical protein
VATSQDYGQPVVSTGRSREHGPRDLYEVPQSEVPAMVQRLDLDAAPLAEVCRGVLSVYGLRKLTQKAEAFIQECREYRWVSG